MQFTFHARPGLNWFKNIFKSYLIYLGGFFQAVPHNFGRNKSGFAISIMRQKVSWKIKKVFKGFKMAHNLYTFKNWKKALYIKTQKFSYFIFEKYESLLKALKGFKRKYFLPATKRIQWISSYKSLKTLSIIKLPLLTSLWIWPWSLDSRPSSKLHIKGIEWPENKKKYTLESLIAVMLEWALWLTLSTKIE